MVVFSWEIFEINLIKYSLIRRLTFRFFISSFECVCTCMHVCAPVCIGICTCVHSCICVHVCTFVCVAVWGEGWRLIASVFPYHSLPCFELGFFTESELISWLDCLPRSPERQLSLPQSSGVRVTCSFLCERWISQLTCSSLCASTLPTNHPLAPSLSQNNCTNHKKEEDRVTSPVPCLRGRGIQLIMQGQPPFCGFQLKLSHHSLNIIGDEFACVLNRYKVFSFLGSQTLQGDNYLHSIYILGIVLSPEIA